MNSMQSVTRGLAARINSILALPRTTFLESSSMSQSPISPNQPPANDEKPTPYDGKIRYQHLRIHKGELRSANNPTGIYNKGGATLCYQRTEDGKHFRFAFSICSIKDNFNRFIGRQVSGGFFDSSHCYVIGTEVGEPNSQFLQGVVLREIQQAVKKQYTKFPLDGIKNLW